jgi:hypothetical protein
LTRTLTRMTTTTDNPTAPKRSSYTRAA